MIFSYDHRIIHVGRDIRRFLLQPSAQSVASSEVRPVRLRVGLVELGKPQRMETAQTLSAPKCLSALMAEQVSP